MRIWLLHSVSRQGQRGGANGKQRSAPQKISKDSTTGFTAKWPRARLPFQAGRGTEEKKKRSSSCQGGFRLSHSLPRDCR